MAVITNALLAALRTGLQTTFDTGYNAMVAESFVEKVATVIMSDDESETYGWLGDFPEVREWVGDRVVKDMKEGGYQIFNKDWEATVEVLRPKIEDDKLGSLTPRVEQMARSAATHPQRLIAQLMMQGQSQLCYDGQNFFDTDHPVAAEVDGTGATVSVSNYDDGGGTPGPAWYLLCTNMPLRPFIHQKRKAPEFETVTDPSTGGPVFKSNKYQYGIRLRDNAGYGFWQCAYKSHAALTIDNVEAAEAAMIQITADGGRPLGIMPNMLVVPPKLKAAGRRLVELRTETGGGDNPLYGQFDLLTVPFLQ